jgi:hypothetical protein
MQYLYLPVVAFLAAALVLVPLPWHWRARNVGTLAIIAWLFVINMIYGINTIVWAGNVSNPVPLWCDICEFSGRAVFTLKLTLLPLQPLNSSLAQTLHCR